MVGGPLDAGELLTPTIGYTVTFGMLHGYVEAYGPRARGRHRRVRDRDQAPMRRR